MRRDGDDLLARLEVAERRRAPYRDALAAIVADTLAASPPPPDRPIAEIGAGAGQLATWLPPALLGRCLFTEPAGAGARALRGRAPEAAIARAAADALPFATGRLGAVLGLCVLDAVEDLAATAAEIARVLAPGGRFIHFLDMATLRRRPFTKLAAEGLVPIPNVLGIASDDPWPLDMLLLERDWLAGLLRFAERAGHPLASTFAPVFAPFLSTPFESEAATEAFRAVARHREARQALGALLVSASELARAEGHPPLDPRPFRSGRHFQGRLDAGFAETAGFVVERSELVTNAIARAPAGSGEEGAVAYRSLCLGHEEVLDTVPERLLCPPLPTASPGRVIVEAGMFVFVAKRLA